MRITTLALLPVLAIPVSADLASSAFGWAADLLSGKQQVHVPSKQVHTFDSWKWSDCGEWRSAIQQSH